MAFRELPFRLDRVNGSIGLDVDQQAVVTRIVPGGPADGKIQVGDRMVRIFGEAVQSGPHFNSLLISRQVNPVTLSVFRKEERREGKDGARPGFEFKDIVLVWNPNAGQKLGLAIKAHENAVYISTVEPNSLCSLYLVEGDRVVLVDGKPAVTKDVARQLIVLGFQQSHRVTLRVERAVDDKAKSEVSVIASAMSNHDPSVAMASDVLDIAMRMRDRLERKDVATPAKPLVRGSNPAEDKGNPTRVGFRDAHSSKVIGMDNESQIGNLAPVPRKQ